MRLHAFGLGLGLLIATQQGCGGSGEGAGGAGAGHTGGGGTGGSPSGCEPGSTQSCYEGPAGTAEKGVCKAGKQTCKADGSGYGACEGHVLPQPENCATKQDEDCDGSAPACSGDLGWGQVMTGPDSDAANGVCTDAAGNVYVVGDFGASLKFKDGTKLTGAAGSSNTVVAKLDPHGALLWTKTFPSASGQRNVGTSCAALPKSAGVALGGFIYLGVDFGDGPITATAFEPYVAEIDDNGKLLWAKVFVADSASMDKLILNDDDGSILMSGHFSGMLTFDASTTLTAPSAPASDAFLLKLDPKGKPVWAKQLRGLDAGNRYINGIAIGPHGVIGVAATGYGPADFGAGPASTTAGADNDAVVGLIQPDGKQIALLQFGDASNQSAESIAFDPAGNAVVAGYFSGQLDFGNGSLITDTSNADIFVLKLDDKGKVVSKRGFGSMGTSEYAQLVLDGVGNIVLFGQYGPSPLAFGSTTLPGGPDRSAYVAKLDPNFNPLWAKSFVTGDAYTTSAAVDAQANILVSGIFNSDVSTEIDFDATHKAMGDAGYDMFLVKLAQ